MSSKKGRKNSKLRRKWRKRAAERDGWQCWYCGVPLTPLTATLDHVIPRAVYGGNKAENHRLACAPCNEAKADKIQGGQVKQGYTHIAMLLDRSGSMDQIASDVQAGLDKFLREQRELPGEATFELYLFDDRFEHPITPRPISEVKAIRLEPRASTALLDAMAKSIKATGKYLAGLDESERPERVLFVIVTDGLENASRNTTRAEVFDLVTEQRDRWKWEFMFLAANQDAIQEGARYGFAAHSSSNYTADAAGTASTFAVASAQTASYRSGGGIKMPESTDDGGEGSSGGKTAPRTRKA